VSNYRSQHEAQFHAMLERIQAEAAQRKRDAEQTCWFCEKNSGTWDTRMDVPMYGQVSRGETSNYVVMKSTQMSFQKCEVTVPRCPDCKKSHAKIDSNLLTSLTWLGSLVAGYFIVLNYYGFTTYGLDDLPAYGLWAAAAFGLAVASAMVMALVLPSTPDYKSRLHSYPAIKRLLSNNWDFGDRPPGTV